MMSQLKAYPLQIHPNKEQEILIQKTFGCARFVHNHFLELWKEECLKTGKGLSNQACSALLSEMKNEEATCWLKSVDSMALQSSLDNLMDAFSRFYRNKGQHPQFKSKKDVVQSYTTKNLNHCIALTESHLELPKLGLVSYAKSQEPKGSILNATISRNASGEFLVSILCEEDIQELPQAGLTIGTDLGITHTSILSGDSKVGNPHISTYMEKKLKREQRKLSRRASAAKEDGRDLSEAKNYQKQRLKVENLQKKLSNPQNGFLKMVSTEMNQDHDVLCMKD